MMLALFLLSQVATLYAPIPAAVTQHQQSVVFPKNQNRITSASTPMADAQVSKVSNSPKTAIAQCSPNEFKSFFEQFVRNPLGRDNYTSSEVQIRDYQDPSLLVMVIREKDYVDFRIGAIGNKYVNLAPFTKYTGDDELLKNRLKLDFQRIDAKTFRVNYIRAEFLNDKKDGDGTLVRTYGSPEAYIFEHRDGCWLLTQSLRQYKAWKESRTNNTFTKIPLVITIRDGNLRGVRLGKDDSTYLYDRVITAYTDFLYYKKLDGFGYARSEQRDHWREWNVIRDAVNSEFISRPFRRMVKCSGKDTYTYELPEYDDLSGTYTSQSLDRIAMAIVEYQASQSAIRLSPEALKDRWLEIRKKISINTNIACVMVGG